jgi:superfamily II DNA or RNA helicase
MPSNCEVFNIEVEQNHNYFANGILVHNCHHYVSSAYKRVIDYYRQNPNLKVLGITATPQRHDKLAMGAIFQSVAFTFDILAGIDHGWLVPIDQQLVTVEKLDLSAIHTVAGDLNQGELSQVLEDEKNLHDIAAPVVQIVGNRKTLIFCASLKQAERVCEIINRLKPESARWVHGGTPKEERRQLFADYANRRFQFLVNVGVATEGFDDPGVEVVVMARPTKSTSLYTQVIGRGTRPLAGLVDQYDDPEDRKIAIAESSKQAVLIIDMVGNSGKHKLITSADILGGKYPEEVIAKAKAKAESQAVDMRQALEEAAEELAKEREEQQRREAAKRAQVKAKATYSTRKVDPFDILDLQPHRDTGWDTGKPLTEKMVEFLEQRGVNTGDLSYAEAGRLINEIKRRYETGECSYKQAKLLKKYGLPTNAKRTEAKEWIDAIAANGWKLPAELDAMREPMEIF